MITREEVNKIISELSQNISSLFPGEKIDMILYGSYVKGTAEPGSDIDVMFLVDSPRNTIAEINWQVGDMAAELLLKYGIVVSPIVENREFFSQNSLLLPFFRNINNEGVRISA